jgi:V/A-type H+-transporting ATPase subunit E
MTYVWITAILVALIVGYLLGKSRPKGKKKEEVEKEELGVKQLIERIRTDGIKTTEEESAKLRKEAEGELKEVRKKATEEIKGKLEATDREITTRKEQFEQGLKIAARDFLLELKGKLEEGLLRGAVSKEAEKVLADPGFLKKAVLAVVSEFGKESGEITDIELLLPKKESKELKGYFMKKIGEEIAERAKGEKARVKIGLMGGKVGFKVAPKGKNYQLDITLEALTDSFVSFLRPDFRRYFLGEEDEKLTGAHKDKGEETKKERGKKAKKARRVNAVSEEVERGRKKDKGKAEKKKKGVKRAKEKAK